MIKRFLMRRLLYVIYHISCYLPSRYTIRRTDGTVVVRYLWLRWPGLATWRERIDDAIR